MKVTPIKTRIFKHKEALLPFITEHVAQLENESILLITSKILSLSQNRIVSRNEIEKKDLVENEADVLLGETYQTYLTIKNGILIPAAGIDESNSEQNDFILWPTDPYGEAKKLHRELKAHYNIDSVGIVFTDSRCTPLRKGVSGVGISHWGFKGIQNHIGKKDLFGRDILMSTTNAVDCIASAAVLVMGESNESCPMAIMEEYNGIRFSDETDISELIIGKEEDIFAPLFSGIDLNKKPKR